MAKAGIIGHFGYGKELANGQTIKTKTVTGELRKQLGRENVITLDTGGGIKKLFIILLKCIRVLKMADNVIIMPAYKGLRILAPYISFFNFFEKKKIHYIVIGGWLPEYLEKHIIVRRCLKLFHGIYVETEAMKRKLERQKFNNVVVLPNSKDICVLAESELKDIKERPYRLCTFSRVMKEKGIEEAVYAVECINKLCGKVIYTLDIYGQIEKGYLERFERILKENESYIRYKGVIPSRKSVEILSGYYLLLFPTYYKGEGFAGTLIDAFSAGLPVVASDWKYNSEIVTAEVGFLYSYRERKQLVDLLVKLYENNELVNGKRMACLRKAKEFSVESVISVFCKYLD